MIRLSVSLIPVAFVMLSQPTALAQDSAKPSDMLKPSEINTVGESSNPTNESGGFVGAGLTFGQARTTEDVSPGVATLFFFEPGYQVNRGSWNRLEFSGQVFAGRASFGDSDVNVGLGLLAKIGMGYSLGDRLMAMFKLGAGPVMATFKSEIDTGTGTETVESDGTLMGLGLLGAWQMVFPMSSALDLTGGLSWTHMQFNVDDVKSSGTKYKFDKQVIANVPAVDLGLRFRF